MHFTRKFVRFQLMHIFELHGLSMNFLFVRKAALIGLFCGQIFNFYLQAVFNTIYYESLKTYTNKNIISFLYLKTIYLLLLAHHDLYLIIKIIYLILVKLSLSNRMVEVH